MNIDKAIRKQNKSLKRFLFSNCFVFLCVLVALIFIPSLYKALKMTLIFIEIIILLLISNKLEEKWLRYVVKDDRILVKSGLTNQTTVIRKNKVVLVHTEDTHKDIKIIIIVTSKIKKRTFKPINKKIILKSQYINETFEKIKKQQPSAKYFYTVIFNGGFTKYKLLNDIYINCERAFFTDSAIESIKLYRNVE